DIERMYMPGSMVAGKHSNACSVLPPCALHLLSLYDGLCSGICGRHWSVLVEIVSCNLATKMDASDVPLGAFDYLNLLDLRRNRQRPSKQQPAFSDLGTNLVKNGII